MSIQILSNLNYPIGNIINQELQNAQSARIAIAFLKYSGIKVIEKSLNQCLDNNGSVEIIPIWKYNQSRVAECTICKNCDCFSKILRHKSNRKVTKSMFRQ